MQTFILVVHLLAMFIGSFTVGMGFARLGSLLIGLYKMQKADTSGDGRKFHLSDQSKLDVIFLLVVGMAFLLIAK